MADEKGQIDIFNPFMLFFLFPLGVSNDKLWLYRVLYEIAHSFVLTAAAACIVTLIYSEKNNTVRTYKNKYYERRIIDETCKIIKKLLSSF